MMTYYLAVDIGASSGRHILAHLENGKIVLEEVYRFKNNVDNVNGQLCWDTVRLFTEIKNGIKQCKTLGKIPVSMGIDTWGVDFVLLDEHDNLVGDTVAYRDSRTEGMDDEVYKYVPAEELYAKTGIQKQLYNTIYQLMSIKTAHPEHLEAADKMLMIPNYFHYLLTGNAVNEYTLATTGNLVNAESKDWDFDIIDRLGFPRRLFGKLGLPGDTVGDFTPAIAQEVGFSCKVVLPGTHDTASAVAAVPANDDDFLYISSGTWSLLGVERMIPDCSEQSRLLNFTNEGGINYRFRYLKNIMGLWIIQSIKRELKDEYGFGELSEMAKAADIDTVFDVDDQRLLAPASMIEAVKVMCAEAGGKQPQTVGELVKTVYLSLAKRYGEAVREMEQITGRTYTRLHIVGGGCQDGYLNKLTAEATGLDVYAGPIEATALGNLMVQMLADGVFASLEEGRECIGRSFDVNKV
ncbi:MAG: rhamnulokinase [Clostridia bacterium]|nr:rhamnulokinase [Clostridia bacterium]